MIKTIKYLSSCLVVCLFSSNIFAENIEPPYEKVIDGIKYSCINDRNKELCGNDDYFLMEILESNVGKMHILVKTSDTPKPNTAWRLVNFPNNGYRKSLLSLTEYDCKNNRSRTVLLASYKNYNGLGVPDKVSNDIKEWAYLIPGSIGGIIKNIVCEK